MYIWNTAPSAKINYLDFTMFATMKYFLKFYVMSSPEIDLCGIFHVKADFIVVLKIYVLVILGRFV